MHPQGAAPGAGKAEPVPESEQISRVLLALHFILLLGWERVMVVSVDHKHPRLLRMLGFAAGPRRCQCSRCSVQYSDLSLQGRLTAFLVNRFSHGVGVKVTLHSTEDKTGPVGYVLQWIPRHHLRQRPGASDEPRVSRISPRNVNRQCRK